MAAGTTAPAPRPSTISMAGINNDHTEAATITPEANPSNDFCRRTDIPSRIRNTKAAPDIVPSRGINNPMAMTDISIFIVVSLLIVIKSKGSETKERHEPYTDTISNSWSIRCMI